MRDNKQDPVPRNVYDALNVAFSHKYHSMAQYILEAGPYVRPEDGAGMREIELIAAEDKALADHLADVIERLEGIPQVGLFNPDVANLNYLSLEYLLGVLIRSLEDQLAQYEASLPQVQSVPLASQTLEALCAATRGRLERLRALAK
ncbi:hypothetical protein [uncultured Desulfobulbus sp.]|uniref:hypothetical protein n=1 Tax=uncultured Desulfobulbus sp. TaxID=239745 RepID=UPI0029C93FD4|nr:hypothetical protein [uncultured Desulfobulbus sp.]